jgi:methionine-rich copper-binding protein CopC
MSSHGMRKLIPVVALAATLGIAAPASAHVGIKKVSPKRGSTVDRPLKRVKVTFQGAITDGHLTVRGPSGRKVSIGDGTVVKHHTVLRVRLKGGLGKGRFSVSMEILNTDGHIVSKSWSYKLK